MTVSTDARKGCQSHTMSTMIRVLRAARISQSSDDSTSLTRQDRATQRLMDSRGWKEVETAIDDGVSASKVAPFDRPGLGPWLTDPVLINSYDVIVWWRLDRAVRSMRDLHALTGWAKDHNKKLMFAEGPGGGALEFDMSNPLSALILTVIAFAAEMEAQAIKERVQSSHDYLATQPRWAAGPAPYGYRTIDRVVDGVVSGKTLEVEPEQAKIINEVIDYILGGESLGTVARLLNNFHVPAPQAEFDYKARNPMWHATTLHNILRSVKLVGQKEAKGQAVFNAQGEAVMLAEPIIDMATFRQLQKALDTRSQERTRTRETAPLLGIIFCGVCGKGAWRQPEHREKDGYLKPGNYHCYGKRSEGVKPCKGVRVREEALMRRVDRMFLENIGPLDRPVRTFIPGSSHTAELENVECALENLRAESDAGLVRDRTEYINRLAALTARQEKLAALPAQPDRWEEMPSGKTWGQWWEEESNVDLRRDLLLAANFKVWLLPGGDSVAYWPGKSGLTLEEFLETLKV
jgi:site-specific DNA recombinase